jgi:O-antigen/teichoic acid export membrane protein
MSKATEMAKVSVKGGFYLLWGLVASTAISARGTIIIAKLLGASNYGLYSVALTAPNLISNFRDWGINTAMIKYSAQYFTVSRINQKDFSCFTCETTSISNMQNLCNQNHSC